MSVPSVFPPPNHAPLPAIATIQDKPLSPLISVVASNAPPDDTIGDVMPVRLFSLTQGNNTLDDIAKISHVIERLPVSSYIQTGNFKIKTINKIPTGVVTLTV